MEAQRKKGEGILRRKAQLESEEEDLRRALEESLLTAVRGPIQREPSRHSTPSSISTRGPVPTVGGPWNPLDSTLESQSSASSYQSAITTQPTVTRSRPVLPPFGHDLVRNVTFSNPPVTGTHSIPGDSRWSTAGTGQSTVSVREGHAVALLRRADYMLRRNEVLKSLLTLAYPHIVDDLNLALDGYRD